jgi:hypothetical protein
VIAANAGLKERELLKLASLASAMADALRGRGVTEPTASLVAEAEAEAEAGVAVFKVAFERWIGEPGGGTLSDVIRDSVDHLRAATAGQPSVPTY